MRKILFAGAACLLLTAPMLTPANAQTTTVPPTTGPTTTTVPPTNGPTTTTTPSIAERTGANAVIGATPSTTDFVIAAANSDMFEIQSSQLALQRSNAATKTFATHMIADHQKTTSEMAAMVQAGTVKAMPPTQMDATHQKMLDHLKGLNGDAFTKAYHSDQVTAHRTAVSLFQRYASGGDNVALKAWAGQTVPALQAHLQMAQNLNK